MPLSSLTSNSAALPPSATMRVATARPRPETPPVTTARIESGCMRSPGKRKAGILTVMAGLRGVAGRLVGLQPARELVRPQARREQEALADRHAQLQQEPALLFGFHALGHQPQPEAAGDAGDGLRSEEHTSELQSLMRIPYAVFCLQKKTKQST